MSAFHLGRDCNSPASVHFFLEDVPMHPVYLDFFWEGMSTSLGIFDLSPGEKLQFTCICEFLLRRNAHAPRMFGFLVGRNTDNLGMSACPLGRDGNSPASLNFF